MQSLSLDLLVAKKLPPKPEQTRNAASAKQRLRRTRHWRMEEEEEAVVAEVPALGVGSVAEVQRVSRGRAWC